MKCCEYSAGMLRTPVQFQRKLNVPDGAGGFRTSWVPISGSPTRAHYKALSGSERMMASRLDAQVTARIAVRYTPDVAPGDRVLVDGEAHNITFVNNLERRNRWLEMDLKGGVAT
jgi:SPP1 family predicted phage head-tail adaptor